MASTRRVALALCCCAVFTFGACREKEQARVYKFHGTIVRLDPGSNVASIHNDKVDGWMDSMTMQYPIEDKNEYKSLRSGERISAELNVTTDGYFLRNIHEEKDR